jgi:hypothetical protein
MGGCSTVAGREGRSSTTTAQTARWRGNAGGRRGEHAVYIGAARLWGDGSATGDAVVVPCLDRRAYGGAPPTDRQSAVRTGPVRRGPWRARAGRIPTASGRSAWGRAGLGRRAALGGARRGTPRSAGVWARRRPGPIRFAGHQFEINFLQTLV